MASRLDRHLQDYLLGTPETTRFWRTHLQAPGELFPDNTLQRDIFSAENILRLFSGSEGSDVDSKKLK